MDEAITVRAIKYCRNGSRDGFIKVLFGMRGSPNMLAVLGVEDFVGEQVQGQCFTGYPVIAVINLEAPADSLDPDYYRFLDRVAREWECSWNTDAKSYEMKFPIKTRNAYL